MSTFTDAELVETEETLLQRLREVYGDKLWILAGEIVQGVAGGVGIVRTFGARDALAIASRIGVGEIPDDVRYILSDGSQVGDNATMVERMQDNNRELHDLPPWVIAELDDWEPNREANVIVSFTADGGEVGGRPVFGGRKPEWAALEDKIQIRELWAQAGITTAPDRVVVIDDIDALLAAHAELGTRWGTVWAVDNDNGWHGGGVGTHWVPTTERATELAAELADKHRRVRIQPFLEGVPCSIHGMVLAGATLAFRPCEMIVLLDEINHSFTYSRAATFWDPTDDARADMRTTARAIGDALRAAVDFRGVFTVDGVLTTDGFRPTEVNPRFGAALPPRLPTAGGEQIPMFFTHLAAVTGHLDDFDPGRLEALLLDRLDENRAGTAFMFTPGPPEDGDQQAAIAGDLSDHGVSNLRIATDEEDATVIANVNWGTNNAAGLAMIFFTDALPIGPPVAPVVVAIRELLDERWNLGLDTVRPAFD
jgi:hypothetical protein